MLPRAGNKIEQMALRSRLGESTGRFAVSRVLQPEIKANLPIRLRAQQCVRAYNHEIRPEVFADSRQALGAQAVQIRERKFHLHARNALRGNRAHVFAGRESVISQSESAVESHAS